MITFLIIILLFNKRKLNSNVEKANQNAALLQDKSLELFSKITDPNSIKSMPDEIKYFFYMISLLIRINNDTMMMKL